MKETLIIEVIPFSDNSRAFKLGISGSVGKIAIQGTSLQVCLEIDRIDEYMDIRPFLPCLYRADGYGKSVPDGARRVVEAKVLERLLDIAKAFALAERRHEIFQPS